MQPPLSQLSPDPEAAKLARSMLQHGDVARTVVEETIQSAREGDIKESGRTTCGAATNIKGPIARRFRSVKLPTCPRRVGGSWHSHTSTDEMLVAHNSLPDVANVVFGTMDVSIVVGAERGEVVVSGDDRALMRDQFVDAFGVDVGGPREVADAVLEGEVADPAATRRRVKAALGPELVWEFRMGFSDLAEEIRALDISPAMHAPLGTDDVVMAGCFAYELGAPPPVDTAPLSFQQQRRGARRRAEQFPAVFGDVDVDVRDQAIGSAIGTIVAGLVNRVVFG